MAEFIHLVGFGSQGAAWAECLKASGWDVSVYLPRLEGSSFDAAEAAGFAPKHLTTLRTRAEESALVAMLCPDHVIGTVYRECLASLPSKLTLVLAHGYAVYAGELRELSAGHGVALLAPKAIGPKLAAAYRTARSGNASGAHDLVAAIHAGPTDRGAVLRLAGALGFADDKLIAATFEQEAVGDLISEQALLCGGLFTLLEATMNNMAEAGVPASLIREECLTELELIAGMLRERGMAGTFRKISANAQAGTVLAREVLRTSGAETAIRRLREDVVTKRFVGYVRDGAWRDGARSLAERLEQWDGRLK